MAIASALTSTDAFAQASAGASRTPTPGVLSTPTGHVLNVSVQHYEYVEPPPVDISIHGPKIGAEYTGTFSLNQRRRWFAQLDLRGTVGNAAYDGNCRPWQIVPSDSSPNGYRLTLGATSPCSETGDSDWYVEGRALAGKDIGGRQWGLSPFTGIGVRHLSNGTTGTFNFRTDEYLYLPLGVTARTTAVADRVLGVTIEYDRLLRGWQKTRNSLLGGGVVPSTESTPSFAIGDFTDISFPQHHGWALRVSAHYALSRSWSLEPYYLRWHVADSPVKSGSVAFTVNAITARQTLNFREPVNFTNEFGVKVGWHFGER
jgi:hypothetical protein